MNGKKGDKKSLNSLDIFVIYIIVLIVLAPLEIVWILSPWLIGTFSNDESLLVLQVTLMVLGLPAAVCAIVIYLRKKADKMRMRRVRMIAICAFLILFVLGCYGGRNITFGNSDRTMGHCWVCGRSGSFQLDGSYYCFKHYNQRLFD